MGKPDGGETPHEKLKQETKSAATKLRQFADKLDATNRDLTRSQLDLLEKKLAVVSENIEKAKRLGQITELHYFDLRNDVSAIGHILHRVRNDTIITMHDSLELDEVDQSGTDLPIYPDVKKFPESFRKVGVKLSEGLVRASGAHVQVLDLPIKTDRDKKYKFYSIIDGNETQDSYFTEISWYRDPPDLGSPKGGVLRLKTSLGEIATFTFEMDGKVKIESTKPNGRTKVETFLIENRSKGVLQHIEFYEEKVAQDITVIKTGNRLVFWNVPVKLYDRERDTSTPSRKENISIDISLPPGIAMEVVDNKWVVLRDTMGIGFSGTGIFADLVEKPAKGEIIFHVGSKVEYPDGHSFVDFDYSIDGTTHSGFSDPNLFIQQQMTSIYQKETQQAGFSTVRFKGRIIPVYGPARREKFFRVESATGQSSLLINPDTGKIIAHRNWQRNAEIGVSLPKKYKKAQAYLNTHPDAIVIHQKEGGHKGDDAGDMIEKPDAGGHVMFDQYWILTFGDYERGGYQAKLAGKFTGEEN